MIRARHLCDETVVIRGVIHLHRFCILFRSFRGVIQAGDESSACRIRGNRSKFYKLSVPHNKCGTSTVVSTVIGGGCYRSAVITRRA